MLYMLFRNLANVLRCNCSFFSERLTATIMRMADYPISSDLIKQAFSAIRLYRPKTWPTVIAFQQYYEQKLNVTVSSQRAWTLGRSKPNDWIVIEKLATDAVRIGRLPKTWLIQFLESLEL